MTREQLIALYCWACELDVLAFKPGNVSVHAPGHDMTADDFRRSAEASASWLTDPELTLGAKIYHAVAATRAAVGCNTNLGIILLCAPLLQAAEQGRDSAIDWRAALQRILTATTIEDAEWVFRAICLAAPGGLGASQENDVHAPARVNLHEAMRGAAERDLIAKQYVSYYKDVFEIGVFRYNEKLNRWHDPAWAMVAVFTGFLSKFPDSHVERKHGTRFNGMIAETMMDLDARLLAAAHPNFLIDRLYRIDSEFKTAGINPGTTADLSVASVLAAALIQHTEY